MQINFTATNPAELKATGEFILNIARMREADSVGVGQHEATLTRHPEPQELPAVSAQIAAGLAPQPEVEPEADKPKRHRRTKAEMEAARAAEQQEVAPEPEGETHAEESVAAEPAAQPTADEVRAALQAFVGKHGMPDALVLLKTFDAERVSEVPAERYAEFIEKASV